MDCPIRRAMRLCWWINIARLKKVITPIARAYGVKRLYLFGSYAKGNANENSDVDLLIEKGKPMSLLDNGVCIVGDLEPIEYLGAYEENVRLKADWELVMSYNPKFIYYAHANEKVL